MAKGKVFLPFLLPTVCNPSKLSVYGKSAFHRQGLKFNHFLLVSISVRALNGSRMVHKKQLASKFKAIHLLELDNSMPIESLSQTDEQMKQRVSKSRK